MNDLTWIRAGLLKPGKTQKGLADALGKDESVVSKMLANKRAIKATELPKIRAYLEAPTENGSKPPREVTGVDNPQPALAETSFGGITSAPGTKPLHDLPRSLKILGSARAGAVGFFLDQGEIQGMARRPPILEGIADAFAVYVRDESMLPAYKPGWVVYIHPHRPIKPGDDVIVELTDGQALIKALVRRTEKKVTCRQHNPPKDVEYDAGKVKRLYLVVGTALEG